MSQPTLQFHLASRLERELLEIGTGVDEDEVVGYDGALLGRGAKFSERTDGRGGPKHAVPCWTAKTMGRRALKALEM